MGIFDLLKKKETQQKTTDDFNIFSQKGLVDYIKTNLKNPTDENVLKVLDNLAKPSEDLEHLDENGELPWGWHSQNKDFIEKTNNEYSFYLNNWLSSTNTETKKQCESLKAFIVYLEDVERLCKSKGECFEFWFYEILTAPDYIQKRKEELEKLQQ